MVFFSLCKETKGHGPHGLGSNLGWPGLEPRIASGVKWCVTREVPHINFSCIILSKPLTGHVGITTMWRTQGCISMSIRVMKMGCISAL